MFLARFHFLAAVALVGATPAHAKVNVTGNKLKLNAFTLYELISNEITDMEAGGARINLPSCYRSTAEQARICNNMGCPGGCPGRCAPPGRSNHQHHPTCDWSGIPGDVKKGCEILLKVCNKIKARAPGQVGCEIGGYGSGAHHLAAGPGVKNSAYNQCSHLKQAVQQDPPKEPADKLKNDGDNEYNDVMNNNPRNQQSPMQQLAQAAAQASPPASYPRDTRGGSWADSPHGATSPTPETNPRGNRSKEGDAFNDGSRKVDDPRFGPGHENPQSSITKRGFDKLPDFAGGYDRAAATGNVKSGGAGGDGSSRGGAPGASGGTKVGGGSARSSASEALSSFRNPSLPTTVGSGGGGGGSSGGGRGGAGSGSTVGGPAIAGAETDAAVKNYVNEFTQMGARAPASGQSSGEDAGPENGETIFQRVHAAHRRCIQGGCVTAH